MTQTIAARNVKLHQLKESFGLQLADDAFFPEWCAPFSDLTTQEKNALDRVKRNYLYLLDYPIMESIVKMVVLSPLLDLSGFYEPPFRVAGETSVQVSATDEGDIVQGSIDVLVLHQQLWVTVIEAKNSEFSITKAIPQTLAYMLASPHPTRPSFGSITNGSEFLFLKLIQNNSSASPPSTQTLYGQSNLFSLLNRGNDLYQVAQILKHLGQLAIAS